MRFQNQTSRSIWEIHVMTIAHIANDMKPNSDCETWALKLPEEKMMLNRMKLLHVKEGKVLAGGQHGRGSAHFIVFILLISMCLFSPLVHTLH